MWFALACTGPVVEEPNLEILTTSLPPAVLGELYSVEFEASGAEGDVSWMLDGEVPADLVFNPFAGSLGGIPNAVGTFDLVLTATDASGATAQTDLQLVSTEDVTVVECDTAELLTFDEGTGVSSYEVDWTSGVGRSWIEIPLPPPETTRLQLTLEGQADFLLTKPGVSGEPVDLWHDVARYVEGRLVNIDPSHLWTLDDYRAAGEPIRMLVLAQSGGEVSVTTSCTPGPVLLSERLPAVRAGEASQLSFSAYPSTPVVEYRTEAPLPAWMTLDASTGQLTATPPEEGFWPFVLQVADAQGNTRRMETGLGAFVPVELDCDTPETELVVENGVFVGTSAVFGQDPSNFAVLTLPIDELVSAVDLTVAGFQGTFASLVDPGRVSSFGGSQFAFEVNQAPVTLSLGPNTWPPRRLYGDTLTYMVSPLFDSNPATVTVACDTDPQLSSPLPTVQPGQAGSWELDGIGGMPPYRWSASGLPSGVTLSEEGMLAHDGSATAGSARVDITLLDDDGVSLTASHLLHVGDEAACGSAIMLGCGEYVTGVLGPGEVLFCLPASLVAAQSEVALFASAPGPAAASVWLDFPGDTEDPRSSVGSSLVFNTEGEARLTASTWPSIDLFDEQPVFFRVQVLRGETSVDIEMRCTP